MDTTYIVEVKSIGGWTTHSTHASYREAIDQADMVHGRVARDGTAWHYARQCQGCELTYEEWRAQDDDDREQYERGAAGLPSN